MKGGAGIFVLLIFFRRFVVFDDGVFRVIDDANTFHSIIPGDDRVFHIRSEFDARLRGREG